MPELPDIEVYVEHLRRHVADRPLEAIRLRSPFVLRTKEALRARFQRGADD